MKLNRLFAAAVLGAACALPAWANDTSAEMAAGGLVFTRNEGVRMLAEDLYVSASEVRVAYRFLNTTDRDLEVLVAFPMPDVPGDPYRILAIPSEDPQNLLAFHTTVDGVPVQAQAEQRAFLGEVEVTDRLERLGVPLAPHLAPAGEALDALPEATRRALVADGLALEEEFDAGQGPETHLAPLWTLKTTWFWTQVFPAGREVAVQHRYTPATGVSAGTLLGLPGEDFAAEQAEMAERYCIDEAFMAPVRRAAQGLGYSPFLERRIAYVLTTGANWGGPIGDFRLVVDKGSPDALVSFCAEGVRKIGPTRFEVRYRDYTPTRDLSVLILERTDR